MHSFLNEMNVMMGQLYILGILLKEDENFLERELRYTKRFLGECRLEENPGWFVRQINPFKQILMREVSHQVEPLAAEGSNEEIGLTLRTLDNTLSELMERACQVVHLVLPEPDDSDFLQQEYLNWLSLHSEVGKPPKVHFRSLSNKVPVRWKGQADPDSFKNPRGLGGLIPFLLNYAPAEGPGVELEWHSEPGRNRLLVTGIAQPPVLDRFLEGAFPLPPENDLAGFYLGVQDLKAAGLSLQWESGLDGLELSLYP